MATELSTSGATALEEICVVCSVDSGMRETQAVRMAESLRAFGGRAASAPVVAITPRFGPPLAAATLTRFDDLGVTYARDRYKKQAWYPYAGKVWAARRAAEMFPGRVVVLVDCDVLFLAEPEALRLDPGIDVAACPTDDGLIGTVGPSSPFEPAWRRSCEAVGLTVDDLPWVTTHFGVAPIRFYVNVGVVVLRPGARLQELWLDSIERMLASHVWFPEWGAYFVEQVAFGLSVVRGGYSWAPLPISHNYPIHHPLPAMIEAPEFATARVLHYHSDLLPETWRPTVARLRETHPDAADWVEERGPMTNPAGRAARVAAWAIRQPRMLRRRAYGLRGRLELSQDEKAKTRAARETGQTLR